MINSIKTLFDTYFSSLRDMFTSRSYSVAASKYIVPVSMLLLAIACMLIVSSFNTNKYEKSTKKKIKSLDTNNLRIYKIKFLKYLQVELSDKLDVYTGNKDQSDKLATVLILLYVVLFTFIVLSSFVYSKTWYMVLLNLVVALCIPLLVLRVVLKLILSKVVSELPNALGELESALYMNAKFKSALKLAIPEMPERIGKSFMFLYKEMLIDELVGIEKFRSRFNNVHINSLCILLRLYATEGSHNLALEIQRLNAMISTDIKEELQSSSKLAKYKILAGVTLVLIPVFITLSSGISSDIREYYTSSVTGSNLVTLTVVLTVCYYLFVELMDRI